MTLVVVVADARPVRAIIKYTRGGFVCGESFRWKPVGRVRAPGRLGSAGGKNAVAPGPVAGPA